MKIHTEGRLQRDTGEMLCEDRGLDEACASKGPLKIVGKAPGSWEEAREGSPARVRGSAALPTPWCLKPLSFAILVR